MWRYPRALTLEQHPEPCCRRSSCRYSAPALRGATRPASFCRRWPGGRRNVFLLYYHRHQLSHASLRWVVEPIHELGGEGEAVERHRSFGGGTEECLTSEGPRLPAHSVDRHPAILYSLVSPHTSACSFLTCHIWYSHSTWLIITSPCNQLSQWMLLHYHSRVV